jgi:protein-tyrosine phosphatase
MAEAADLVLTMTRNQRAKVLGSAPRGLRKTFTLLEAADLAGELDVRSLEQVRPAMPARVLALRLDAGRRSRHSSSSDDILDPIGRRAGVHREVADRIAAAVRTLVPLLLLHTVSAGIATQDQEIVRSA